MKKLNLKSLKLLSGSHSSVEQGLCIMEAVAYFAGEKHSDKPECACPVLTSYMIKINDSMNEEERQKLKPYIKKLIGTKDGNSAKRLEILVHHACTKITPFALELANLPKEAEIMRQLKMGDYSAARSAAWSAAESAELAELAAWSAARSAAESAAWSAAWSAAAKDRKVYWKMALKALDEALKVGK